MPERERTAIDAWANLALPGTLGRTPDIERLFRAAGRDEVLDQGLSIEATIQEMDAAGIERAVVTLWHRSGSCADSDEAIAQAVRSFPQRFVGAVSVDPRDPYAATQQLKQRVVQDGFRALRLVPWLWNRLLSDPLYYPLFETCTSLNIPVCTQVGHTGPLSPSEPGRPIPYLERVALDFPNLRIVGGHLGYPWVAEMIVLAEKFEHVYIDTSAHLPKYYPAALIEFINGRGRDKVLFATNFPMLGFEKCRRQAEQLALSPTARARFLGDNACEVFQLPD